MNGVFSIFTLYPSKCDFWSYSWDIGMTLLSLNNDTVKLYDTSLKFFLAFNDSSAFLNYEVFLRIFSFSSPTFLVRFLSK